MLYLCYIICAIFVLYLLYLLYLCYICLCNVRKERKETKRGRMGLFKKDYMIGPRSLVSFCCRSFKFIPNSFQSKPDSNDKIGFRLCSIKLSSRISCLLYLNCFICFAAVEPFNEESTDRVL